MTDQPRHLIAIDPDALAGVLERLARLEAKLDAARIAPEPEWLTLRDYADRIGVSPRTVQRRLPTLETRCDCGVTMIRVNRGV